MDAGLLAVKRGEGTFVADTIPAVPKAERSRALAEAALRYASTAVTVGASRDEADRALDSAFSLMGRGNYEILVEWLTIAAGSDYEPAFPKIREVLSRVGRMKYLRPLFNALGATERTRALAREIFAAASPTYHGLSRRVVAGVIEKYGA